MMGLKEVSIWNIKYNLLTLSEIVDIVSKWIDEGKKGIHLTGANADTVALAQKDEMLQTAILDSDIVNVDSTLPAYFLKRKGYAFDKRVPTPDVLEEFFKLANSKRQKVFFLGAKQETLDRLEAVLQKEYPNMIIVGMQNGYYRKEEEEKVVNDIAFASPDYLFIALPSPRKEHFIMKYKKQLTVGVFYGVGGALDAKAGILKRPPKWLREYGIEWCLRLIRRPSVYSPRVPLTISFLKLVISERWKQSSRFYNPISLSIRTLRIVCSQDELAYIPEGKTLINTINAYSYVVAQTDEAFAEALKTVHGEGCTVQDSQPCVKYLLPDGASIVKACRWLKTKSQPKERIAGWDLFVFEMNNLERKSEELKAKGEKCLSVMFLGSSEKVLDLIRERAAIDYPNLDIITYSPPYKPEFSDEDNQAMIRAINDADPDLLWIGMTAPKQEKWAYQHWGELNIHCHCGTIGAVFDFYAGTKKRAPLWWQMHSLEWLFRLLVEPLRMWRRYLIGNIKFLYIIYKERGSLFA